MNEKPAFDTCPVCESKDVSRIEKTETITYEGCSIELPNFVVDDCGRCGEQFPTPESIARGSEAARRLHSAAISEDN